jgi:adenylylsulfate kinase-like enzyme
MHMKTIQTNWIVFSGVTSSGKTTIADLLIRYGYKAPTEVARVYINELC